MPPKRETVAATNPTPVKMMKIATDAQDFVCDPLEDKYRFSESPSYSPFAHQEVTSLFCSAKYLFSVKVKCPSFFFLFK